MGGGLFAPNQRGRKNAPTCWRIPALEQLEPRNLLSFFSSVNYSVGQAPVAVVVGDFNGDGKPDLAAVNQTSNTVSLLLGNGDGSFQPARNFDSGGINPSALAVGDFNRDGKLDLAVTNLGNAGQGSNLSVFLGNGDGTFRTPIAYNAGPFPASVAVGDFNGDHILDLVVANRTAFPGEATVFLGYGDGTFQPGRIINLTDTASFPTSVAVGDFNGDGNLDFVVANEFSNNISVVLGNGDGTFGNPVNYVTGSGPASVVVGDFNGDGKLDIATANFNGNDVSVLLGNGNGTFPSLPVNFAAGFSPTAVAVGDFNGDGIPDLAVTNGEDSDFGLNTVSVLLGNGDGMFAPPQSYVAGQDPYAVAVGDFNTDSMDDLVVVNRGISADPGSLSVFLNLGFGLFPGPPNYPVGFRPYSVTVGSFNGVPDIVTANNLSDDVSVLLNDPLNPGFFLTSVQYNTGDVYPEAVIVGDFNNDGKLDIAVANFGDFGVHYGSVSVFLGNGNGTFQRPPVLTRATDYLLGLVAGDFNRDGNLDLAVWSANQVTILLGNGNGSFSVGQSYSLGPNLSSVVVGDFNRDGKLDLAVANNSAMSTVSVLLGNGDGTFGPRINSPAGPNGSALAVGDFNGDGILDLAITNRTSSGSVSVLLGNGNGTFLPPVPYLVGTNPTSVAVADFNGDGRLDIAVANVNSNTVSVLLGNGDGTFRATVSYGAGGFPVSLAIGDFNSDMLPDLAIANNASNDVWVLINAADWPSPSIAAGVGKEPSLLTSTANLPRRAYVDLGPASETEILTLVRTPESPLLETPRSRHTAAMASNSFATIGRRLTSTAVGGFWYNRWSAWSDEVMSSISGHLLLETAFVRLLWEEVARIL